MESYRSSFEAHNGAMWADKLGLGALEPGDQELLSELSSLLQAVETDMTIFFRSLCSVTGPDVNQVGLAFYDQDSIPADEWNAWLAKWWSRVDGEPDRGAMRLANPKYVLRNWMAQLAIDAADKGDYSVATELHDLLRSPYEEQPEHEADWYQRRPEWARHRVGCSMLSCSS
jgi:uncharacterized protein YdiU (UPF0061 family)